MMWTMSHTCKVLLACLKLADARLVVPPRPTCVLACDRKYWPSHAVRPDTQAATSMVRGREAWYHTASACPQANALTTKTHVHIAGLQGASKRPLETDELRMRRTYCECNVSSIEPELGPPAAGSCECLGLDVLRNSPALANPIPRTANPVGFCSEDSSCLGLLIVPAADSSAHGTRSTRLPIVATRTLQKTLIRGVISDNKGSL